MISLEAGSENTRCIRLRQTGLWETTHREDSLTLLIFVLLLLSVLLTHPNIFPNTLPGYKTPSLTCPSGYTSGDCFSPLMECHGTSWWCQAWYNLLNECAVQSQAWWADLHGSDSSFTAKAQYSSFMLIQTEVMSTDVHAGMWNFSAYSYCRVSQI